MRGPDSLMDWGIVSAAWDDYAIEEAPNGICVCGWPREPDAPCRICGVSS